MIRATEDPYDRNFVWVPTWVSWGPITCEIDAYETYIHVYINMSVLSFSSYDFNNVLLYFFKPSIL